MNLRLAEGQETPSTPPPNSAETTQDEIIEADYKFTDIEQKKIDLENELIVIDIKYDSGKKLLKEMRGSMRTIKFINSLILIEQEISLATSVWADDELRLGFDRFDTVLSLIGGSGGVIGSLLLFSSSSNNNATLEKAGSLTLAAGLGTLAASKIASLVRNQKIQKNANQKSAEFIKKLNDKFEFLELTREAYSDLSIRRDRINSFNESVKDEVEYLESFEKKYEDDKSFLPENAKKSIDKRVNSNLDEYLTNKKIKTKGNEEKIKEIKEKFLKIEETKLEISAKQKALVELKLNVDSFLRTIEELSLILKEMKVFLEKCGKYTDKKYDSNKPIVDFRLKVISEDPSDGKKSVKERFTEAEDDYNKDVKPFLQRKDDIASIW
jgi:hypothetical protein